jgi:hypothetical protein
MSNAKFSTESGGDAPNRISVRDDKPRNQLKMALRALGFNPTSGELKNCYVHEGIIEVFMIRVWFSQLLPCAS